MIQNLRFWNLYNQIHTYHGDVPFKISKLIEALNK